MENDINDLNTRNSTLISENDYLRQTVETYEARIKELTDELEHHKIAHHKEPHVETVHHPEVEHVEHVEHVEETNIEA